LESRGTVKTIQFEAPSWKQIYKMLLKQAEKIRNNALQPDVIVGVSRGGWVSARVLSDLLENPAIASVGVEAYSRATEAERLPILTQRLSLPVNKKHVLIVDDVADSGKSLKVVKEHVLQQGAEAAKIATLYYKPWSNVKPDYYEKETSKWIVFPWDRKETVRRIIEENKGTRTRKEIEKLTTAGLPKQLAEKFLKEISAEQTC
jgi:hypoxanthine phosphoribosyltransferase